MVNFLLRLGLAGLSYSAIVQIANPLENIAPRQREFPNLEIVTVPQNPPNPKSGCWYLIKKSEDLSVRVYVEYEESEEVAIKDAKRCVTTTLADPALQPVAGNFEGKMLGDHCWHLPAKKDGSAVSGGFLSATHGRYTVFLLASKPLVQGKDGKEMITVTKEDLKLVDAIAASFVKKIAEPKP